MKWHTTYYKMVPDKLKNVTQHAMKWRPISYKMVPNFVLRSLVAGYLYVCFLSLHLTCLQSF